MTQQQDYTHPHRLHPISMLYRGIVSLPSLIVVLYTTASRSEQLLNISMLALWGCLVLPGILLGYYYFTFSITRREIVITRGVFSRTTRNIPIERVQNISIQQNFLQRLLGIARVYVETAGGTETEGVLEYIATAEAESIRQLIRSYQHEQQVEQTTNDTPNAAEHTAPKAEPAPVASNNEEPLFSMSFTEVLLCGMFSFSLVFVALIFTALQYMGIAPEEFMQTIANEQIQYVRTLDAVKLVLYSLGILLVAVVLSWITGILLTLNRYYKFHLALENGRLHTRSGLLTVTQATIPLKKLQMLVVRSTPFTRYFGFRALDIQTAGLGAQNKRPEVAVPLAREHRVLQLAQRILPFDTERPFLPVSPRTIRRAMVRYSAVLLLATGISSYFLPVSAWIVVLLPLLYYAAVLRFQHRGYVIHNGVVLVKQGFWRQRIAIIPIEKIQTVSVSASFFQRRLRLASLHVDTAASSSLNDASIVDIDADDAHTIAAELMQAFHSTHVVQPAKAHTSEYPAPSTSNTDTY